MEIDLLCNDGSPIGVIPADVYGRGLGGAELAMVSLTEVLARRGHKVRVFNDPRVPGLHDGVEYLPLGAYVNRARRDALIIFRSPNARVRWQDLAGIRAIWWSTDQWTTGDFGEWGKNAHFIVTISPRHTAHFKEVYGLNDKIGHIDLGVRLADYQGGIERVRNRLIFCSIPERGLPVLHAAYPLIKKQVPDASLVITSDYRLWGVATPGNQEHRLMWAGAEDVQFLGRIPRAELAVHQQQAEIMAYPCTYDELFCIAAAECQVAGALPVTSTYGSLPTTNEWGILLPGHPVSKEFVDQFVDRITSLLTAEHEYLDARRTAMMRAARVRFDYDRIAEAWEYLFEHGKLPA